MSLFNHLCVICSGKGKSYHVPSDEALSGDITAKTDLFFFSPNTIIVDHLRASRDRRILSKFLLDLTMNSHKKGKTLLLKYFKVKFRNNFSQDERCLEKVTTLKDLEIILKRKEDTYILTLLIATSSLKHSVKLFGSARVKSHFSSMEPINKNTSPISIGFIF